MTPTLRVISKNVNPYRWCFSERLTNLMHYMLCIEQSKKTEKGLSRFSSNYLHSAV